MTTSIDTSIDKASEIVRLSYKTYRSNRHKTILLSNSDYFNVIQRPIPSIPVPAKKVTKPIPPAIECRCRAYKMDGNICNAKTKGGEFCMRHSKKMKVI